ncbi:MAG: NADH-quinone oxidoreductase subunit J [Deltaproteobacteria bacterium]|nr:NADH-quinone oxidoreductase subunit J [Deltaproteobacteria bacterium]
MKAYDVIFYLFALLTVLPAIFSAFHPNILYAALSLFISFFGVAGLYALLAADFVAAAQVLIYVGGILILLLFAVMLSKNIYGATFQEEKKKKIWPSLLGMLFLGVITKIAWTTHWSEALVDNLVQPTTARIGHQLLTDYLLPFELSSLLLLSAFIGAITLARSK